MLRWAAAALLVSAFPCWAICSAERMETPVYPTLAIQARRSAVIHAWVSVDAEGYPRAALREPNPLFAPSIHAALARTRLSPADCADAEFAIVFRFSIRGTENHRPETAASFHSPGEFEIVARPLMVQWSRSAPNSTSPRANASPAAPPSSIRRAP